MSSLPSSNERLRRLERRLHESIRGQEHVISRVMEQITIGESDLVPTGRPKGSFLFIGPTGVGKTELARILAQELYDGADPLRFDMAEFSAHDAIKNFIGDQTGNLGRLGSLLSDIQGGILLADEIEKAHPDVVAVYLAILDAARVTCGHGRLFDLSNFYLIFTSNLGAADILRARHLNFTQMERHILAQVAAAFRPEFLGRIDSKHVFRKLSYDVQLEIAKLNLALEQQFLLDKGHRVSFADDVLPFLIQIGFDKYLGARPLRQAMHKQIRFALAQHLHRLGRDSLDGTLKVTADRKALYFQT
jgi:ATP-dependent Clp protease ATP-binding subunit ClpB